MNTETKNNEARYLKWKKKKRIYGRRWMNATETVVLSFNYRIFGGHKCICNQVSNW